MLEAFLIFRPAHRAIVTTIDALEENNEQLKQQEAEAFAALEDAEDAWVEAEQSKKESENLLETTKDQALELRKELNVFMSASHSLIERTGGENLNDAQRGNLSYLKRLTSTSQAIVWEFADSYASGKKETIEKEEALALKDVVDAALETIKHHFTTRPVWVEAVRDMSDAPKIMGRPSHVLRTIIGTVLFSLHESGASKAQLDMKVVTKGDNNRVELRVLVHGAITDAMQGDENALTALENDLRNRTQSVFTTSVFQSNVVKQDEDTMEFSVSWPVTFPASTMKIRKPVRQARRVPPRS